MPFVVDWTEHWWEEHTGRALRKQKKTKSGMFPSRKRAEVCISSLKGLALSGGTGFSIRKATPQERREMRLIS